MNKDSHGDFIAIIRQGSPREQDWLQVLGSRKVELKAPFPQWKSAPGYPAALFYEIDLGALKPDQRARLIVHIARRFQVPVEEVERDLDAVGCPILAEDVGVMVFHPQRWI